VTPFGVFSVWRHAESAMPDCGEECARYCEL
jgi:hypothetical protein